MERSSPRFLEKQGLQLLVFGGKGGVGKTTCATACALHLALRSPDEPFLLVSTDPAHSLADSLDGMTPPGNLKVLELDARQCLEAFRAGNAVPLREIAAAGTFLDDEDIQRFLDLSLPGLDELMAFLEISGWVDRCEYSTIVVDTAPSGHALRLLEIPQLLAKWLGMLDALLAKRRFMRQVFRRSVQPDRLDLYLADWQAKLHAFELLLRDPRRTQFVPVTTVEPMSIGETVELLGQLQRRRVPVPELIVNQIRPAGDCGFCSAMRAREWRQVQCLLATSGMAPDSLWGVDLLADEVRGPNLLLTFWAHARPLEDAPEPPEAPAPVFRAEVEPGTARLAASVELVVFSGKGGVGKTTLACAAALRFAEERPGKRVLLFSTGPAHSTSESLGKAIGSAPVPILPNLSAMNVDAGAEFAALKAQYVRDIEGFLEAVAPGFDLTFDRTVLERLMDLAPPGLDEVMALTRIVDLMMQGRYDLFVLDAASTGHLVRLLEMPELIDQWLKAFFSLFLKYENILRLPGFTSRLVELSKSLKVFRRLIVEEQRAILCAVCIPARMALEETRDLVEACARMRIRVPSLFLNLMTPADGECRLCTGLRTRELLVAEAAAKAFPGLTLTRVCRQGEVAGLAPLRRLGRAMYGPREAAVHAT